MYTGLYLYRGFKSLTLRNGLKEPSWKNSKAVFVLPSYNMNNPL